MNLSVSRLVLSRRRFIAVSMAQKTMYAQWKSVEEYEAMRRDPCPLPFFEEALMLAKFDPGMYEVVRTFSPVGSP